MCLICYLLFKTIELTYNSIEDTTIANKNIKTF